MVVDLTGVLEVGGTRSDHVPANPRRTLRFSRGSTVTIRLTIVRSDGGTPNLAGAEVRLVIRKNAAKPATMKRVVITLSPTVITLLANDTKLLEPGSYTYDVWLVQGSARDAVVPLSPCIIEPVAAVLQ